MSMTLAARLAMSAACIAVGATPVLARDANRLQNLVGARAGSGEAELERHGFTYIGGHEGQNYVHSYWWHAGDRNCVEVKTADGRYDAIVNAPNRDCNQRGGDKAGAAIAGAAVGALVVAAIASSHKSSHHENGRHYDDWRQDDQFERGYSHGVHHAPYHNYERSDFYARGYEAGIDQRQRNTYDHSGRGGYRPHASLHGIKGQDSIWAIDEMRTRGFRNVDTFNTGNTRYAIYYKGDTGQCVQMTNADNRVYDVREIGAHPKCR